MKRLLPITYHGEIMLAAISVPPLTTDANRHAPSPAHPGNPDPASNAAPTAATAKRAAPAGGVITGPPSSTASAANPAPTRGARTANRRTQPRAVVYGTPARSAARHTTHPPDAPASTPPITSATSGRHASANAGNNAWLTPHEPHRTRGTNTRQHSPASRTQRRYPDQNTTGPAHDGQSGRGNSTSRSAAA